MEIKGSAVKSIVNYVKINHPDQLDKWLDSLPENSKKIMSSPVYATSWYPMQDAATIPTRKISEMFFKDTKEGAWQTGRYSAELSLTGVYKIFVKAASPGYIIKRASKIFATFYSPTELKVVHSTSKSVVLHITKFPTPDKIIEYRIGGWMEKALELSGCKGLNIRISKSLTAGNEVTEYTINWN